MHVNIYIEKQNLYTLNKSIDDKDASLIPEFTNQFPWQYPRRGNIMSNNTIGISLTVDDFIWLEDNRK